MNIAFTVKCTVGYKGYHPSEGFYLSFTKDKCYKVENDYIYDDLDGIIYVGTQAKCAKDVVFGFHEHHMVYSIDFEDVDVDIRYIDVVCVKARVSYSYNTFFTPEKHYKIYDTGDGKKYIMDDRLNEHRVFMNSNGLYTTDGIDPNCFEVIDKGEEKEDLKGNTDMIPVFKRVDYSRPLWFEEFVEEDYETYYVDGKPYNIRTGGTLNRLITNSTYGRYGQFNLSKEEKDYIAEDTRLMMELFETKCKKMYFGVRGVPEIEDVKFNGPATIVFWDDGTKTVVKCQEGDTFDPEKGLTMAICKKLYGNKGNYCNKLKKWLPEEKKEEVEIPISKHFVPFRNEDELLDLYVKGVISEEVFSKTMHYIHDKECTVNGEIEKPTIDEFVDRVCFWTL